MRLRTILVDDSPLFLQWACKALVNQSVIEIIGMAQSGLDAIKMVEVLRPDLVIMDISMPKMDGLEATMSITHMKNPPRVIIATFHDTPDYRTAALSAGAFGFVEKSQFRTEIMRLVTELRPHEK